MFIAVVSIPNPKARAGEAFTHVWATLGAYPTREQAQTAIDLYAAKKTSKRKPCQPNPAALFLSRRKSRKHGHPARNPRKENAMSGKNEARIQEWVTAQIEALPANATETDLLLALFPPDWDTLGEPPERSEAHETP